MDAHFCWGMLDCALVPAIRVVDWLWLLVCFALFLVVLLVFVIFLG